MITDICMLKSHLRLGLVVFASSFANLSLANNPLWTPLAERSQTANSAADARYYHLDIDQLKQRLKSARPEHAFGQSVEISLPNQAGMLQRFSVVESPILAPHIAAQYPDIKTYRIRGIDDPSASGRIGIDARGFNAMVTKPGHRSFIDQEDNSYRQYSARSDSLGESFKCDVAEHNHANPLGDSFAARSELAQRTPSVYRRYRLALAATGEYVDVVGNGDTATAFTEVVRAINRVAQVFERDLAITFQLVTGENTLYPDSTSDPYSDGNTSLMIDQNQSNLDKVVGSQNYDIGHLFSKFGGGLAGVGVVCRAGQKAQGVTGRRDPTGDDFYIDYVAHEMGHQFDADHSFNGTSGSCSSGRTPSTAWEPGSGSSIMAYAGICDAENLQSNSDAAFHIGSINQIDSFVASSTGQSCGVDISSSNSSSPIISVTSPFTIPASTPFELTASASDADADLVTYTWDQMDAGTATTDNTLGKDLGDNALFRSHLPRFENTRHFPALGITLAGQTIKSETLPTTNRTINFRVSARDGRGGLASDDVAINVVAGSSQFAVTSHTASKVLGANETVIWEVAGTDAGSINCANVDISLLTFNDSESSYFETELISGTPNDGSESVSIPQQSANNARIKVKCSDNIFYALSSADLEVVGSTPFETSGDQVFSDDTIPSSYSSDASTSLDVLDVPLTNQDVFASDSGGGSSGSPEKLLPWLFGLYLLRRLRRT